MYGLNWNDRMKYKGSNDPFKDAVEQWELADDAIIFHGLEKCITGTDQFGHAIYDHKKMVENFMRDGMTEEESLEWIDYNVVAVNAGQGFVIHYYD